MTHTPPTTRPAATQPLLFEEPFANLDHWHLEGKTDGASLTGRGELRLDCKSKMGFEGVMAFCRQDFPDNVAIAYDFLCERHNGLFITFVAMTGTDGQD